MNATTRTITPISRIIAGAVKAPQALVRTLSTRSTTPRGKSDHDAGKNQQRHAVADAALGDLLAQPHDERAARGQGQHGHQNEAGPGIDDEIAAFRRLMAIPNDWTELRITVR